MTGSHVTAIIVTYSGRAGLAEKAALRALDAGVDRVVIVANGSPGDQVSRLVTARDGHPERIELIALPVNVGSAGGFRAGLEAALVAETEFVWLLDDDNQVAVGALQRLHEVYEKVATPGRGATGLFSYRPQRPYQRLMNQGAAVGFAYPARSAFLYFSLVQRLFRRVGRRARRDAPRGHVSVPYGPYGGFFAHRSTIQVIGLPNTSMVLYEDDAEYTHRVRRSGGDTYMVFDSVIREPDDNWTGGEGAGRGPTRLLLADSDWRVYYAVRNRVYFETRYWRRSGAAYAVNKSVYLAVLAILGVAKRRAGRLRLILRAVSDGENGRLGMRGDMTLP